jgi:hypothetical protein
MIYDISFYFKIIFTYFSVDNILSPQGSNGEKQNIQAILTTDIILYFHTNPSNIKDEQSQVHWFRTLEKYQLFDYIKREKSPSFYILFLFYHYQDDQ